MNEELKNKFRLRFNECPYCGSEDILDVDETDEMKRFILCRCRSCAAIGGIKEVDNQNMIHCFYTTADGTKASGQNVIV